MITLRLLRTVLSLLSLALLCSCSYWYQDYGLESKSDLLKSSSVPVLIDALDDEVSKTRLSAAIYLNKHARGAEPATSKILERLKVEPSIQTKTWLLKDIVAIGKLTPEVTDCLVALLKDRSRDIRFESAIALYQLGYKGDELVPALRALTFDGPGTRARNIAARALSRM